MTLISVTEKERNAHGVTQTRLQKVLISKVALTNHKDLGSPLSTSVPYPYPSPRPATRSVTPIIEEESGGAANGHTHRKRKSFDMGTVDVINMDQHQTESSAKKGKSDGESDFPVRRYIELCVVIIYNLRR